MEDQTANESFYEFRFNIFMDTIKSSSLIVFSVKPTERAQSKAVIANSCVKNINYPKLSRGILDLDTRYILRQYP